MCIISIFHSSFYYFCALLTPRCMPVRAAIMMSAVFNFLGVFVMTQINSSVASIFVHF